MIILIKKIEGICTALHCTPNDILEFIAEDENAYNFLLEGDNLHSLKLLEKTYTGKIDVIYIEKSLIYLIQ